MRLASTVERSGWPYHVLLALLSDYSLVAFAGNGWGVVGAWEPQRFSDDKNQPEQQHCRLTLVVCEKTIAFNIVIFCLVGFAEHIAKCSVCYLAGTAATGCRLCETLYNCRGRL